MHSKNFDAAISFASEQRKLARSITRQVTPLGYKIYYDDYYETWGEDLSELLHEIYSKVKVVIILVSREYLQKPWTSWERKAAIGNYINRSGKILQIKIDDTALPGIPEVIQYKRFTGNNLHELCSSLLTILGPKKAPGLTAPPESLVAVMQACFRRAIFTAMKSEISSEAMFQSLRSAIAELNRLLPTLRDGGLSQYVKSIISDLNNIDRYSSKSNTAFTCSFSPADQKAIDSYKISIVDKLHYLNYVHNGQSDLPDDIGFDFELRSYNLRD